MSRCLTCGRRLTPETQRCPACDGPHGDQFKAPEHTPIARFSNAAEAGFFAHELLCLEDFHAEVVAREQYDALAGLWRTQFILTVAPEEADAATELLQALIAQSEQAGDESPYAEDSPEVDRLPHVDSGVNWVPIVLTLAAGSAVFLGFTHWQQGRRAAADVAPPGDRLWERLATPNGPWTQPVGEGRGSRQLLIEPGRRLELREDADGDGVFESAEQIPLPPE